MVVSSRCAGPRSKMPGERARFAFLGQSAAGRRMTAEDELEQPSGSGRSSTLALRKTLSWTSVTPSCTSLNAWLAVSGATSEVVWRQFDLLAGRRLWLSCSEPAAVRRKSRPVHRIEHDVTVVQSGSDDTSDHRRHCVGTMGPPVKTVRGISPTYLRPPPSALKHTYTYTYFI